MRLDTVFINTWCVCSSFNKADSTGDESIEQNNDALRNDTTAMMTLETNNKHHAVLAAKDKVKFRGARESEKVLVGATKRHNEIIATTEKDDGVCCLDFDNSKSALAGSPKEDGAPAKGKMLLLVGRKACEIDQLNTILVIIAQHPNSKAIRCFALWRTPSIDIIRFSSLQQKSRPMWLLKIPL